ncbi:MAG: hypothetical protein ACKVQA_15605, partial [Burkholderiales bacterium]
MIRVIGFIRVSFVMPRASTAVQTNPDVESLSGQREAGHCIAPHHGNGQWCLADILGSFIAW